MNNRAEIVESSPSDHSCKEQVRLRQLGLEDYESVWQRMTAFTNTRTATTLDELWLVEHPPVFTLGQVGKPDHILDPADIPVVHCDRGGQVTYHGPGQLVAYVLVDLTRRKLGVRELVNRLEDCLINTLAEYGVVGQRVEGAPGVYVGDDKIAALGLRVRRGCSFHGMSLNVSMDLLPFSRINPCGYSGLQVVHMADFLNGRTITVVDVAEVLCRKFSEVMHYSEII